MKAFLSSLKSARPIDARLAEIIEAAIARCQQGEAIEIEAIVAQHPEYTEHLRELLPAVIALVGVGGQTSNLGDRRIWETTSGSNGSPSDRRLTVRCPNCHQPTQVAADTVLAEVKCSACGSQFSLIDDRETIDSAPSLKKLGRFELSERVGMGGFGSVWKARDTELDRTVAVKIPRADRMSSDEQEKFFREARAAAQLRHPNIVSVHEVGRDGESLYIVSDFVCGVTLADWLTGQLPTGREAAELCATIADALHHAHEQGVIHRDLKPANIMIDVAGEPHLMDFGLARRAAGEVTMTIEGQVLGTPAYMSPEQAAGAGHAADRRSDVYSLGVVLFQLLSGELPFRGNARMLIHQVIHEEAPSPRKLNANIHRDLETITLKCLEKSPEQRFATAEELANELRRFVRGEPIMASPIGSMARAWRWCKRYPTLAGLSATTFLALTIGGVISTISYFNAEQSRVLEQDARRKLETALVDSHRATYLANLNLAQNALGHFQYESARSSLAKCPKDFRNWEWQLLNTRADQSLKSCRPHATFVKALRFTPDGQAIVSGSIDKTVYVWRPDSEDVPTKFAEFNGPVRSLAMSPDGQYLAIAIGGKGVEVWDFKARQKVTSLTADHATTCSVAFSHDGHRLATGDDSQDATVQIWAWPGGEKLSNCAGSGPAWSFCFSPDDKLIASVSRTGSIRLLDPSEGKLVRDFANVGNAVNTVKFSPDGQRIAVGTDVGKVMIWNVASGALDSSIQAHLGNINALEFTQDGKFICTASQDRTIGFLDVESGHVIQRLIGHDDSVIDVRMSPDGKRLASCDRTGVVKLWDPRAESLWVASSSAQTRCHDIRVLADSSDFVSVVGTNIQKRDLQTGEAIIDFPALTRGDEYCAFTSSADGKTLAYEHERQILVVDTATGKPIGKSPLQGKPISLAFNHDGTVLYCSEAYIVPGKPWTYFIYALEVRSGKAIWDTPKQSNWISNVAVRPKTNELWSASSDPAITIHDARSGQTKETMAFGNPISQLAFDSHGKFAVGSSLEGTLVIWDAASKRKIRELRGHKGGIVTIAFHPTAPRLLSVGTDQMVRIWDLNDGAELLTFDVAKLHGPIAMPKSMEPPPEMEAGVGNESYLRPMRAAFSKDGSTLLIGDYIGRIWYWYARPPSFGYPQLSQASPARDFFGESIWQDPVALNALAWRFATDSNDRVRDGAEAIRLAKRANAQTNYQNPNYVNSLAAAYAETGDFDAAVRWSKMAIRLLGTSYDSRHHQALVDALTAFQEKRPLRSTEVFAIEKPASQLKAAP